ncbi:MAG: MFS transporter, partial [Anaerolineae bacterium]|nr:MFS transporter [Anaerolineae bacterium]
LLYGAWVIASLAVGVRGLPITVAGIALASFIFGVAITTVGLVWINTLQELVPPHLLGRVSSVDQFGSFVFTPVGYGLAGWLTEPIGAPLVMIIGGALSAILAILGLSVPAIRELD